jgi:hypothetical protein
MKAKNTKFEIPQSNGAMAMLNVYQQTNATPEEIDDSIEDLDAPKKPERVEAPVVQEPVKEEDQMRFSVWMPKALNEEMEDKIHILKKSGIKRSKAYVIRDYISAFVYGQDVMCPNDHRFILPEKVDAKTVITCPICGATCKNII